MTQMGFVEFLPMSPNMPFRFASLFYAWFRCRC